MAPKDNGEKDVASRVSTMILGLLGTLALSFMGYLFSQTGKNTTDIHDLKTDVILGKQDRLEMKKDMEEEKKIGREIDKEQNMTITELDKEVERLKYHKP